MSSTTEDLAALAEQERETWEITRNLGKITFSSETILVMDLQSKVNKRSLRIDQLKTGIWRVWLRISYQGNWGYRNTELTAHHLEDFSCLSSPTTVWTPMESVDIGSGGILMVINQDRYPTDKIHEFIEKRHQMVTEESCRAKIFQSGLVTQSGFGPGTYPVLIHIGSNEKVTGFKIVFVDSDTAKHQAQRDDPQIDERTIGQKYSSRGSIGWKYILSGLKRTTTTANSTTTTD